MTSAERLALKNAREIAAKMPDGPTRNAILRLTEVTEALLAWRYNTANAETLDEFQFAGLLREAVQKAGGVDKFARSKGITSSPWRLTHIMNGRTVPSENHANLLGYEKVPRYQKMNGKTDHEESK